MKESALRPESDVQRRLGMIINSCGLIFGALIQIPASQTNAVSFGHHSQ